MLICPHSGSGRAVAPGRGWLTLSVVGSRDVCCTTPSMLIAVSAINCCEKPTLLVFVGAFLRSLAMMPTLGGAVEMNVTGSRPPNGSGYDGLVMLMLFCNSATSSLPWLPLKNTWYAVPYPPRATERPLPVRSQAKPTRGCHRGFPPRLAKSTYGSLRG